MRTKSSRNNEIRVLAHGFFTRIPEDALGRWVPGGHAEVEIPLHHGEGRVLDMHAQPLLRVPDLFFRPLAIRDVTANPEQANNLTIRVAIWPLGREIEARHTRGRSEFFVGLGFPRFDDLAVPFHD